MVPPMRSARALPILLALTAAACGANPLPEAAPPEIPHPPPTASAPAGPAAPPLLPAQVVGKIDDETAAPYFTRRGEEGLVYFASRQKWFARAVGADGAPKGELREIAALGSEPAMASLKPVADGYLLVWTELVAKNHMIKVLSLDAEGKPRGAPALVTQVVDDVTWLDVLPNKTGALVVWEVPRDERTDVFMAPLGAAGKVTGAPSAVAQGVIGWEAEATERGAALATITSDPAGPPAKKGGVKRKAGKAAEDASARSGKLGKVTLAEIDDKGRAGAPLLVSAESSAQIDITLAEISGKYVLAWTDERNIDAAVYLAVAEPGGKLVSPPHRATAPFGEQALVSLVVEGYWPGGPRSKKALLAWEDQIRAPREGRLIHLATLGADGQLGKERAQLVFAAGGPPDLVADGDGFAALTVAPVHDLPPGVVAQQQVGVRGDAPLWTSFVRFAPDLGVLASEPVRAEPFADSDNVPPQVRNLTCAAGKCTAVAIGNVMPAKGPGPQPGRSPGEPGSAPDPTPAVPAPIALVELPKRESPWKAPAAREADEAPPRAVSVTALFDGDQLAKVAGADLPGGGSLAAWVTYVLEARGKRGPKGKAAPKEEEGQSASLGVRALGANGALGKTTLVTTKAVSVGGIALAPAPAKGDKKVETALAWVARVRGEPQVFVTKLGPDGEKLAEKGVTTVGRKKKGTPTTEATDVAIAYAGGEGAGGDGWITAWVDTRDGNAEIYAAKLGRSLDKSGPERRITEAPGDAAEVQIAVRGKDVFLVWSDARAKPEEGNGDIYIARLDAASLKKTGPETRLFASATHSRSPQIIPTAKGFLVSWIEQGEVKGNTEGEAGLRIAELDDKGALIGAPQLLRAPEGTVTSATLGCGAKSCRGILTAAVNEALLLGAFELHAGAPAGSVKTIGTLTGAASHDVSPVLSGPGATSLFFADDAVSGAGRVRYMQLVWP